MLAYLLVNLFVILWAILLFFPRGKKLRITYENKDHATTVFLVLTFLLLLVISGFRGDFTSDYKSFTILFHHFNSFTWKDLVEQSFYQEPGFVVLNKLVGSFSDNEVTFFVLTSLIILLLFFREFRKDSTYIWLSILLFINIGAYYTSFNVTRQILAVSIIFAGSKYIYKRQFIKYILTIFIASLFHFTAWVMLPFYFLLNIKLSIRKSIFMLPGLFLALISIDALVNIAQGSISRYTDYSYGMTGLNLVSALIPVAVMLFALIHHKLISVDIIKQRIWLNASIYYAFWNLASLKVQMLQRFAEFFNPYVLLLIPLIISKIINKKLRAIYIFIITCLLVVYNLVVLSGTGYDPYYFFWN